MRYSYYVYLNHMCDTLQEAAAYLLSREVPEGTLREDCLTCLDAIENGLKKEKDALSNPDIFSQIDICRNAFQQNLREVCLPEVNTLKQRVLYGLNYRFRIVFYVDMKERWDSIHSLYQAFKKRKDCDTLLVIAPVFRAIQDGDKTKVEAIYEDYLTPLGHPFVEYKNYKIEKDCPDLAFYSQPYEGCMDPSCYPEYLSQYTRLVYSPYCTFMLIDKDKSFCELPAYQYTWKILCQSEQLREQFQKYAPYKVKDVIVTGLPKWDGLVKAAEQKELKKNALWNRKMRKKKVFLWCSHYTLASTDTCTILKFGEAIVRLFEQRDDIALIWRLHPLTETVTRLYAPSLKPFLDNLIQRVKNAPNMVMDSNAGMEEAFCYSDAMLSDTSSMLMQYLLFDKPILWLKEEHRDRPFVIDYRCMENGLSVSDIEAFVNRICLGEDFKQELRKQVRQTYLPLADGQAGERACKILLEEMMREDRVLENKEK